MAELLDVSASERSINSKKAIARCFLKCGLKKGD